MKPNMSSRARNARYGRLAFALVCALHMSGPIGRASDENSSLSPIESHPAQGALAGDGKPRETVRLKVRIVDTAGRAFSKATVRVIMLTDERTFQTEVVSFDGTTELLADADGGLLTPPLKRDKPYVLQVDAPGALSALSRWRRMPAHGVVPLPDVVLRRLLTVAGVVVDPDGEPIAGATVIQSGDGPKRTEATTDSKGRFQIGGVPEGGAFLFAEKEGYLFHGQDR